MADEIKATLSLKVEKGSLVEAFKVGDMLADLADPIGSGGVQKINTATGEPLDTDVDHALGGFLYARNISTVEGDYCSLGGYTTGLFKEIARLLPGEWFFARCNIAIWAARQSGHGANDVLLEWRWFNP